MGSPLAQVHLQGVGTADSASTLAKVLLSRLNVSVYGPEQHRRAQQVQYMYQQQMQLMAQNGVQMTNHVAVPVQSVGLPTGGQMQMHGIGLPTQG